MSRSFRPTIPPTLEELKRRDMAGLQEDATRLEAGELAEYIRAKLNLAIQLACEGERERRSGHWESAEGYKCRWGEVMAQVKRLLLVLRNRGVSLFVRESGRLRQEQPARSESGGRTPLAEKVVRGNGGTVKHYAVFGEDTSVGLRSVIPWANTREAILSNDEHPGSQK